MCGRMTSTEKTLDQVADELAAVITPEASASYRPRYNIAPTQQHVVVRGSESVDAPIIVPARWGLPPRGRVPLLINLRAETVGRGGYRMLLQRGRCVVVADGFYEWTGPASQRRPIWFHRPAGGPVYIAAVLEESRDPDRPDPNFAVLTTSPNHLVEPVHNRMPVILPAGLISEWLRGEGAEGLLGPAPEDFLIATPVSARANSARVDEPSLITPEA